MPTRREIRWWPLTELLCLLAIGLACWDLPTADSGFSSGALVALGAYVVGLLVRVPVGEGYAPGTQPAFVCLLFLAPLNLVPALVLAVHLGVGVAVHSRNGRWAQLPRTLGDCWHALPPVVILAWLAPGPVELAHWPAYVAAFAGQFAADLVSSALRAAVTAPPLRWGTAAPAVALDALLTPASVLVAREGEHSSVAMAAALAGLIGLFALLSRERRERVTSEHRALHDPLTGVANRALFEAMFEAAVLRARRSGDRGALLFVDLNDFKEINDRYGHARGDQILRAVAARLTATVRRTDLVARIGGDEFAVLLADVGEEADGESVADKLRTAFRSPLTLTNGQQMTVGLSVGIADFSTETEPATILADADATMYLDKRKHRR